MRNKCLLGLGLVFVISLTSMVAFAFSFTGTPADEVDETEMIVRAVVSEEADAMPTTEPSLFPIMHLKCFIGRAFVKVSCLP